MYESEVTEWDLELVRETFKFYDEMFGHYTSLRLKDLELYTRAEMPYNMRKSVCCPTQNLSKNPLFLQTMLFVYAQTQSVDTLISAFPFSRESIRDWLKKAVDEEIYYAFIQKGFCALCGMKLNKGEEKKHMTDVHIPYIKRKQQKKEYLEEARRVLRENQRRAKEESKDSLAGIFSELADKLGDEIKEVLAAAQDESEMDLEEIEEVW